MRRKYTVRIKHSRVVTESINQKNKLRVRDTCMSGMLIDGSTLAWSDESIMSACAVCKFLLAWFTSAKYDISDVNSYAMAEEMSGATLKPTCFIIVQNFAVTGYE